MMPVRPFHAEAVHRVPDPGDLPGDCPGQEIERNTTFSHGFTLRHPVPASVFRSTSRSGVNGRSSSLTRTISCRIPPVLFCFPYVESMLSLPLLSTRAREDPHKKLR